MPIIRSGDQPFQSPARRVGEAERLLRAEDQQHADLRRGDRKHVGRVAHRDPARPGGGDVDMIVAGAERADGADAVGQGGDGGRIQALDRRGQDGGHAVRDVGDGRAGARGVGGGEAHLERLRGARLHRLR
jgi:hypothetical protein